MKPRARPNCRAASRPAWRKKKRAPPRGLRRAGPNFRVPISSGPTLSLALAAAFCRNARLWRRRRSPCGSCRAGRTGFIRRSASSRRRDARATSWSRRGCASNGCRPPRSKPISDRASGAARPEAMRSRALPAHLRKSSLGPIPRSPVCRFTRPCRCWPARGFRRDVSWLNRV